MCLVWQDFIILIIVSYFPFFFDFFFFDIPSIFIYFLFSPFFLFFPLFYFFQINICSEKCGSHLFLAYFHLNETTCKHAVTKFSLVVLYVFVIFIIFFFYLLKQNASHTQTTVQL